MLQKRDLVVFDQSNTEIRLTLWGEKGDNALIIIHILIEIHHIIVLFILFHSIFLSGLLPLFLRFHKNIWTAFSLSPGDC